MKNIHNKILFVLLILAWTSNSQEVYIGDALGTFEPSAILQLDDATKGLMLPNVALVDRQDTSTISSPTEGLWVYNTATSGSGNDRVSPGHYFFDENGEWTRVYNEGFTQQWEQTAGVRSPNNNNFIDLTGLNQNFVAPYTGTYEIYLSAYIASPGQSNSSREAMVHGEAAIFIDGSKMLGQLGTSSTKLVPGNFLALGQQINVVWHADLAAGVSYNIVGRVRQWQQVNVSSSSLDSFVNGNWAIWGIPTTLYNGNNLAIHNAQDAYLTITLLRQY